MSLVSPNIPYSINRYKLMKNKQKVNIGIIDIQGQPLFEFLRDVSNGQIVIISVMDEVANAFNRVYLQYLSELGLKSYLRGKIRWSYIEIAANGVDGFENVRSNVFLPSGHLIGIF